MFGRLLGKEWGYKTRWLDLHAAALAFYLLLAIVPMLILTVLLAVHFNSAATREAIEAIIAKAIPAETAIDVRDLIEGVELQARSPWILVVSIASLWTTSSFMTHLSVALRHIFAPGIKLPRLDWINRLYSFALLLGWAMILCIISLLFFLAPLVEQHITFLELRPLVHLWLKIARQGFTLLAMFGAFWFAFRILSTGQNYRQRMILYSAGLATLGWIVFGYIYSFFLAGIWEGNPLYGPLGGFVATLVWAYCSCWVILLAACFLSISGKERITLEASPLDNPALESSEKQKNTSSVSADLHKNSPT